MAAAPTKIWMVLPENVSSASSSTRYATLAEARKACLQATAAAGAKHMVLEAVEYIEYPFTDAQVTPLIVAIP